MRLPLRRSDYLNTRAKGAGVYCFCSLIACEEINSFSYLLGPFSLGEAVALIDMCQDVELARSLECPARSFHLGYEFSAVSLGVVFEVFTEGADLSFSTVESIAELLFGSFIHMCGECSTLGGVSVKYTPIGIFACREFY